MNEGPDFYPAFLVLINGVLNQKKTKKLKYRNKIESDGNFDTTKYKHKMFYLNDQDMKTISVNEMKITDLQKGILNLIYINYDGYKIKNAYKVDQNNEITYDVNISKGNQSFLLSFDWQGIFIEIIEPKMKQMLKLKPISIKDQKSNYIFGKIINHNLIKFSLG